MKFIAIFTSYYEYKLEDFMPKIAEKAVQISRLSEIISD